MPSTNDSSQLPNTGSLNQYRQQFTDAQLSTIVGLARRAVGQDLQRLYEQQSLELAQIKQQQTVLLARIEELQRSSHDWVQHAKTLETSTKIYEEQIYRHVASVDQKLVSSEESRAISMGMWDVLLELIVPVRKAAQWVEKLCLQVERLGRN